MAILKRNRETDTIDLYINNEFQVSWDFIDISDQTKNIICSMIEYAIEYGEDKKVKAIKRALALGW